MTSSPRKTMDKESLETEGLIKRSESSKGSALDLEQLQKKSGLSKTVIAGAAFCLASGSMTLLNKAALSSFEFKAPITILFFQCVCCVVLVQLCSTFNLIKLEHFSMQIVRIWYPVNLIFVGMLLTSFWALKDLGVPMSTVLKNMTNLMIITAEYFMSGRTYNKYIWGTMGLMVVSAVTGAMTDLAFNAAGYFWQIVNSGFTAAYMLTLKVVMEKVKDYTSTGDRLDEFSMVFYNNLLSLPMLLLVMWGQGELESIWNQPDLYNPNFVIVACLSGLVAFAISFSVMWFLSTTSPTTFSLVGGLNKIPVSIIGLVLFEKTWTYQNLASVLVGLLAGVLFIVAKQRTGG